ncbi:MAG: hypothetical protein P1U89_19850 [Verrucomicrobiales bacterium]|nr:hypothetical protein [Verrucomicrobiales bacterium]
MKLFIGNLSFDATEPELREILEPFGPILEFVRPLDRETGRVRGFAFITLADRDKGTEAIEALNGKEIHGRQLNVNEAEDRSHHRSSAPHQPWDRSNTQTEKRVDDRPVKKDGKKVTYKSI